MPLTDRSDSLVTRNLTVESSLQLGDSTGVEFKEMATPATPPTGSLVAYAKVDGKLYAKNDAGVELDLTAGASGGEANTASNVGTGGIGLFKQKTGSNLEFRNLIADSAKIAVALDAANNEVGIDLGSIALADLSDGSTALKNILEDTTPQLGGMLDVNAQAIGDGTRELLKFIETTLAVNEITVKNAAAGAAPELQATGDDVNVALNLVPKGTGVVQAGGVEVVKVSGTQTLTGKTLTAPTIGDLTNAAHTHQNAAGGGTLDAAAIATGTLGGARLATKHKTQTKIVYIENPTASDSFPIAFIPDPITVVQVRGITDVGTVDFNIEHRATNTPDVVGTNTLTADLQATATGTSSTTFSDATVPAERWLNYNASAVATAPTKLWVAIEYTIDN